MIEVVTSGNLEEVLPLIKKYQEFYEVAEIDKDKNRKYFSKFTDGSNDGILLLLRDSGKVVAFSTLYRGFSSTRAEEVGVLNDLYVLPNYRKKGYAKNVAMVGCSGLQQKLLQRHRHCMIHWVLKKVSGTFMQNKHKALNN